MRNRHSASKLATLPNQRVATVIDAGSRQHHQDPLDIVSGNVAGDDVHQSDVSLFVRQLAHRWGCSHIVDLGCGRPGELARLHPEFAIVGLGSRSHVERCRSAYRFGEWIEWPRDPSTPPGIPQDILANSLVLCCNMIDRSNVDVLLGYLKRLMEYAPVAIVATPSNHAMRGPGRPSITSGVGWSAMELASLLERSGLRVDFVGSTTAVDVEPGRVTALAVLANDYSPPLTGAPVGFRIVASMAVYNEEDIIVPSLTHLIDQGVEVYLIDNWSTDRTVERARPFLGRGVINIERFPAGGPSSTFDLARLLNRTEEITTEEEADWYMHTDADELRSSPWRDVSLNDAVYHVDRLGFNAIDHTSLQFRPIDDGYVAGEDFEQYFPFFNVDFAQNNQIKTWKNTGKRVHLADGGHRVTFAGRRVYPYNFVYKHYPVRSQSHGERKVFTERRARYNQDELAAGWHAHYDEWKAGHNFLWQSSDLLRFDETEFYTACLVERLGNIGPDQRAAWVARGRRDPAWRRLAGRARRRLPRR